MAAAAISSSQLLLRRHSDQKEAEPAQGGQYGPDFRSYTKQVICHEASPILANVCEGAARAMRQEAKQQAENTRRSDRKLARTSPRPKSSSLNVARPDFSFERLAPEAQQEDFAKARKPNPNPAARARCATASSSAKVWWRSDRASPLRVRGCPAPHATRLESRWLRLRPPHLA
jgi:hypothetical protein